MLNHSLILVAAAMLPAFLAVPAARADDNALIRMDAGQLYAGLEAGRVLPVPDADKPTGLTLDTRNWGRGLKQGQVATDVIDLRGDSALAMPAKVTGLTVEASGDEPAGSSLKVFVRHGPTFFQASGWSDWRQVQGPAAKPDASPIDMGADPYLQVRIELHSDGKAKPTLKSLAIGFKLSPEAAPADEMKVTQADVQKIARSTIDFACERMDQPDLAWFRKAAKLDDVVAGTKSEFDKLVALCQWVGARHNVRDDASKKRLGWGRYYPWNIRQVFDPALENGSICGHCGSYAEVLITAATAMGWQARHIAIQGYRANSHEVVEIWVNELGRWIYFDPSLATYYIDPATKQPLDIVQMHDRYVNFFCEPGKTIADYPRAGDTATDLGYQRRLKLNYDDLHATPVTTDYTYGEHKPFPWQSAQGIMTCGWMQLTPRNNFHSQPQPAFTSFGGSVNGGNGFPVWTDAKAPLSSRAVRWFSRRRDWYWTLNQASLRLTRAAPRSIDVELGNSQPHFDHYELKINGPLGSPTPPGVPVVVRGASYAWSLLPGVNTLEVTCVDAFGQKGLTSKVTVEAK
ncbi:MAG: hypothetical protein BIFFINMI_01652 [Phycisphaerae bacterium]|nr:hypothetical protein [Phycisphaerae bacterium]